MGGSYNRHGLMARRASMTSEQILQDRVGALRMRIRLLIAQQWLCMGLTWAALAGLVLVAATRFQWWTDAMDYLWAVLLAGAIAGLIAGWTRQITPLVAAQIADERAGLKERLSTAVELAAAPGRSEIAEAQIRDAAQHAEGLRPAQVLPWRVPKQLRYVAGALAVLLGVIFIPDLPIFHSTQERIDREVMRSEGARIQRVAKEIEKKLGAKKKDGDKNAEIMRRIAQNMKQLGKDQEKGRISKKQALLKMNALQKAMKRAENEAAGSQNASKPMDRVSSDLRQAASKEAKKGNSEMARQLEQMADNIDKKDLEGAKKQLEQLAQQMQSGKMSTEEMSKMADMLQQMAQSMDKSSLQQASKEVQEAAKKLQQAAQQAKQFQQQMQQAKTEAQKQRIQQQMAQAMQQGMQSAAQQTQKAGGT
jgi:hypothetical protein